MAPPNEEAEGIQPPRRAHRDAPSPEPGARGVARAGPPAPAAGSKLPAGVSGPGPRCRASSNPKPASLSARPGGRGPAAHLPQGTPRTRRPPPGDPSLPAASSRTSRLSAPQPAQASRKVGPTRLTTAAAAAAAAERALP